MKRHFLVATPFTGPVIETDRGERTITFERFEELMREALQSGCFDDVLLMAALHRHRIANHKTTCVPHVIGRFDSLKYTILNSAITESGYEVVRHEWPDGFLTGQ